LRGAFHHTPATVRTALAFLSSGAHPWERLITHRVGLGRRRRAPRRPASRLSESGRDPVRSADARTVGPGFLGDEYPGQSRLSRNVSRKDLLIPNGPSKLKMLALTCVGGAAMALLYVLPPMMILAIVTSIDMASWFWIAIGAAALVFWLTLFTLAVRESAADRRYAEQLSS